MPFRRSIMGTFCAILLAVVLAGCTPKHNKSDAAELMGRIKAPPLPTATAQTTRLESGDALTVPGDRKPILFKGSGVFTAKPDRPAAEGEDAAEEEVTINFVDTDILQVMRAVLGQVLKEPFVVNSQVDGTITIQTSGPIKRSSVLPILEEGLRAHGAAMIRNGDLYTVVPLKDAASRAGVSRGAGRGQGGFRVVVVPLAHIPPKDMAEVLSSVLPEGRILRTDQQRRLVVLGGTEVEVATALDLVETFDVDWLSAMSFGIFPLERARAGEVVKELEPIFGAEAGGPMSGIRLMPIERLNSILVIAPDSSQIGRVERWLLNLDRAADADRERIFIYRPAHREAEDLAAALKRIFGNADDQAVSAAEELAPGRQGTTLRSLEREGSTLGSSSAGVGGGRSAPAAGAPPLGGSAPLPLTGGGGGGGGDVGFGDMGRVRIAADPAKNAVIVRATPRDYQLIEEAMRQLDTAPLQVLVEVSIIEVGLNDQLRYGLQWFFREGNHSLSLSQVASGIPAQIFPGFSYLFSTQDARVVLNALTSMTDVNVVSSPQVLVLDNQSARLQVGDQVPVATQSVVSVLNPDAPIVNTIQYRDTGVILEIQPRISSDSQIVLDIRQEVSDVVQTATSGIDSPTIQQRSLRSTVSVQSGQTIALGGLIRNRSEFGRDGLPLLTDIPVAGALFGSRSRATDRTELIILLSPSIVASPADAYAVTDEMRRRMRRLTPETPQQGPQP